MNQVLDRGVAAPLYKEVKRLLTHSLAQGEWKAGEALPSETQLAQRFGVSIGTLRKAIDELVAEGAVVRRQGRGTFIASHGATRLMFHFFHIVPHEGDKQYPRTQTLAFRRSRADPTEAAKLVVAAGDPVLRIRNLLSLGGAPVILDQLVLPQRLFSDLTEKILTARDNTIYHLYQTRYGVHVLRTSERLRATVADAVAAKLLGVKKGAPLLEINRVAYTYHDAPVELRRSLVNTAAHEYFSDLRK
ncbi:MAG TPA: GntR family transcriptional regulator [Burkholderiales bacterium]|nr:GntR family transcriptional regulator [Burkholderiales bacterium]